MWTEETGRVWKQLSEKLPKSFLKHSLQVCFWVWCGEDLAFLKALGWLLEGATGDYIIPLGDFGGVVTWRVVFWRNCFPGLEVAWFIFVFNVLIFNQSLWDSPNARSAVIWPWVRVWADNGSPAGGELDGGRGRRRTDWADPNTLWRSAANTWKDLRSGRYSTSISGKALTFELCWQWICWVLDLDWGCFQAFGGRLWGWP